MAWTQSDLDLVDDTIRAAITDGSWRVQTIQFSDQVRTFFSLKELRDFRATIASMVIPDSGTRTRYVRSSKGV